ncbi:MAG: acyltransferase [Humibacillus sp.]
MTQTALGRAADVAALTPVGRDRWVDTLRVGSLVVVILGHWLMVVLTGDGQITNALALVPALQPLTWLLQVMPVFFLVGGVAHAHTLDSLGRRLPPGPGRYAVFVGGRARRLLRPTLTFLGVWLVAGVAAHLSGATARADESGRLARDALVMVPQLLWFVGIYLGVSACAPVMRRLHRRWGAGVLVVLVALAVAVDVVRFTGGPSVVGTLNFALVWLTLHQLGFLWYDGRLTPRVGLVGAVLGLASMALLVRFGPYPVSMVGLPGESVSNMAPPTVALLAQGIGVCGLAALVRPAMTRLLAAPRVWTAVVLVSPFAMTAFLWHLTALMAVLVGSRLAGLEQPAVASLAWWLTRPLLFAVLAVVTALLVAAFVRFDSGGGASGGGGDGAVVAALSRRTRADRMAAAGVAVVCLGVLVVSVVGVDVLGNRPVFFLVGEVTPAAGLAVLLVGLALIGWVGRLTGPSRA